MKIRLLYLALVSSVVIVACNQSTEKKSKISATARDSANRGCLLAVDGVDSAKLSLITAKDGQVTGSLLINYLEKGDSDGLLSGKFQGDTLFVDYTFKIGTINKTFYKNPLAFLKRDGKLLMGVGQIETFLGKSSFVKDKPINFERGRFQFSQVPCD